MPKNEAVAPLLSPEARKARRVRIAKRIGLGVLVIGILALATWYFRLYQPLLDKYNAASISLKVREGDTFAIEGAVVSINGKQYTTDQNGKVAVETVAGTYKATVHKDGYGDISQDISLHRGDNDLKYLSLSKLADKVYAVKGFVQDYVDGTAITNVQVTLGNQTVQTDPSGAYAFAKVAPGDIKLSFSKQGFVDKKLELKVKDADITTAKFELVPNGQAIFVSNKTGARALYRSNYDGSGQQAFTAAPVAGEDFSVSQSPDLGTVAFSSTRDGIKDSTGTALARLYVVGSDGATVKKVSDDLNTSFILTWAPDGKHFFYSGYSDTALNQATYRLYDVAKGTTLDLGETAYGLVFSPDGNTVAYYTNVAEDSSTTVTAADGTVTTNVEKVYKNNIKTFKMATGERAILTKRSEGISALAFSSDGKSVSYAATLNGTAHRYQVAVGGGAETEVPMLSDGNRHYFISPNGASKLFIDQRDGKTNLYMVDINGKNEKMVTTIGTVSNQWIPVWDASSRYFTFATHQDGQDSVYVAGLSGTGEPRKIADYYYDSTAPTFALSL